MKKFISIILTIAALVMAFGAMSVMAEDEVVAPDYEIEGNLFANGDFEDGYENWSGLNGGWAIGGAHSGNYAMTVSWGSGQKCYQNVTLEKGKTYIMSTWLKLHPEFEWDGTGATIAFYATSPGESSFQKWNHDLKVTLSKDKWTQMVWEFNTTQMTQESATYTVGFNGQENVVVLVDDFYIGEPVISDIVLSNVTCSISSSQNTGFILNWDEDSVDMDFSEMDGQDGWCDIKLYPMFINQVGTTNGISTVAAQWNSITASSDSAGQGAFLWVDKNSDKSFKVTMAPQFGGAGRANVPKFDVTVAYGDISKDIKFTSAYSSHKVALTNTDGTVITEDDSLTNGTWTPSYKFYNKDMGYVRYMALTVLYENGVMKDFVITKGIEKDAKRHTNSLLETPATDSLTVTDAENSTIKTFVWRQGNGTSTPVWQMEPLFEANVID